MPLEQHPTDPDKLVFRSHLRKGSEMSSPIDLAMQALEVLRTEPMARTAADKAQALLEQIEKAEQPQPVAWRWKERINGELDSWVVTSSEPPPYAVEKQPLYTAPPQRQWVDLTADEIWQCNVAPAGHHVECHICVAHQNVLDFAEAIETKLKEKNT